MEKVERVSPFTAFLAAVQFLLISPAFIRRPFTPRELGASTGYYPLVGALLGGLLISADWLFGRVFPMPLRSALTLAVWVALTGALHLDGFLDACDGLLGGFTPERRLEIMRDERVGAYALTGGVLVLLIQFSALSALESGRTAALFLAPVIGRWAITLALIAFPYARPDGLGRAIKDHARRPQLWLATFFALIALLIAAWFFQPVASLVALFGAILVFVGALRFILRRIPGLTGDTYGAINLLVETSVLLSFAAAQKLL